MPESCRPFRKTGRGVYGCGEPKTFKVEGVGKPTSPQPFLGEGRGLRGPGVTLVRPETGRSRPG